MPLVDDAVASRLYRRARADRWSLEAAAWRAALESSAGKAPAGSSTGNQDVERYLESLHLEDLALACACADGGEAAWEHFVRELRPVLYRAADHLDPSGGARELADSLYADLFGMPKGDEPRRSLFRYFHGRSSLATWLRAVLAQRHVDRLRAGRRDEPLPEDDQTALVSAPPSTAHPDRHRDVDHMRRALAKAVAALQAKDRLRLGFYYLQELTLAEIGRLLKEHEATVSRHLTRTRKTLRQEIERQLRSEAKLSDAEIDRCFESVMEDAGSIDLREMLGDDPGRKESGPVRSKVR